MNKLKLAVIFQMAGLWNCLVSFAYFAAGAGATGFLILLSGLGFFIVGRRLLYLTFKKRYNLLKQRFFELQPADNQPAAT